MRALRTPSLLVALSCILLAATAMPTALGCHVAASVGQDDGAHECCKGKKHGAACPLGKARPKSDPSCPAMRGCDTNDGRLMQLLGQVDFVPEALDAGPAPALAVGLVPAFADGPRAATRAPEPPPPRV